MTLRVRGAFVAWAFSVLLKCALLCSAAGNGRPPADRPHIVLCLADDLGWNDVSYHGSQIPTPFIDSMAEAGVNLDGSYAMPLCTPTRAAILTGRYPYRIGLQNNMAIQPAQPMGMPLEYRTLANVLGNSGYSTHLVGKWHLVRKRKKPIVLRLGMFKQEYTPTFRGFRSARGYYQGQQDYYEHTAAKGYDFFRDGTLDWSAQGVYTSDVYLEELDRILSNQTRDSAPMFIYLALQHVHSPMQEPPRQDIAERCQHIENRARYVHCTMSVAMDELVRDSVEKLRAAGVWDDTVFIFLSDNGGYPTALQQGNNWPLRGGKATLWEGGVRVVSFVNDNRWVVKPKRKVSSIMHAVDWFSTLAALGEASIPTDYSLDSINMWPLISGENTTAPRTEMVLNIDPGRNASEGQSINPTAAIRMGDWKLIVGKQLYGFWRPEPPSTDAKSSHSSSHVADLSRHVNSMMYRASTGEYELEEEEGDPIYLFNVVEDPSEIHNLASEQPELVKEMWQRLRAYNESAVPPIFAPRDPMAWPRFHNGTWVPWE